MNSSGRQLDAEVAEKVLGLIVVSSPEECSSGTPGARWTYGGEYYDVEVLFAYPPEKADTWEQDAYEYLLPHYSTRIEDAMTIVDKLMADGLDFRLEGYEVGNWHARFYRDHVRHSGYAATPSEAVCLAALAAGGAAAGREGQ